MHCQPFICADPVSVRLSALARRAARSQAGLTIYGDAGTGRVSLARYIHDHGARADAAFAVLNCAVVPPNAHMAELFGDAENGGGLLEQTAGGTLVLHNACDLSEPAWDRLLQVIGHEAAPSTPRMIATMPGVIGRTMPHGGSYAELTGRLGILGLQVAPLRERPGDIAPLARHFLMQFAGETGLRVPILSDAAVTVLTNHDWPGHVRELRNVMQRTLIYAEGTVLNAADIMLDPAEAARGAAGPRDLVGRTVADVERELILGTLRHCEGNRTRASEILGISVRTLRNKIRQYSDDGLDVPAYSRAA